MLRSILVVVACGLAIPWLSTPFLDLAKEGEVERAEKEFVAASAKANAAFNDALARAAEQAAKVIDAEMKAATTRGDLEGAIRLRDKSRRYAAIKSRSLALVPVIGVYAAKSSKWGSQDLLLREDKTFGRPGMGKDHESEGKWDLASETLTLKWNDWPSKDLHASAAFSCGDLTLTWKSEILDK
jgi:hypothetical protein